MEKSLFYQTLCQDDYIHSVSFGTGIRKTRPHKTDTQWEIPLPCGWSAIPLPAVRHSGRPRLLCLPARGADPLGAHPRQEWTAPPGVQGRNACFGGPAGALSPFSINVKRSTDITCAGGSLLSFGFAAAV